MVPVAIGVVEGTNGTNGTFNIGFRRWDGQAGLSDLGHVGGDHKGEDALEGTAGDWRK